jgi:hypothetical protein
MKKRSEQSMLIKQSPLENESLRHGQKAHWVCDFCDFVSYEVGEVISLPEGLLVVLQHGAIASHHYFQLVRVFLKTKNF